MPPKSDKKRYKEIRNSKVLRDYFVDETLECGIVLHGTEVKSIRAGKVQLEDAFVRLDRGEATVYHMHVAEYVFGTNRNHNPHRPRKLLLHARERRKWEMALQTGGKTLIPLRMYFVKGLVKVEIGLCRGKKLYDKREDLKQKEDQREMDRALKVRL
ncbi:MAG: SsrA-binding protein SmpB [Opitutales bacterium]|nr:SsrA-binding protein SmpB [Opitutales bacterium]